MACLRNHPTLIVLRTEPVCAQCTPAQPAPTTNSRPSTSSAATRTCGRRRGQAADAPKGLNRIISEQHADAAEHGVRAPNNATAILRDALTAHHAHDCVLNPKVTSTQYCAACAELHVETHRPATVAYDRKTWSPLRAATGADVSEGDQCKRCGHQMVAVTTVTPTTIQGTDYGLITLEGQGLPSVLTWGLHKATLIAGLSKTKDKVWATVIRNSETGTEQIATAKKIANRKEEAMTMAIYRVKTTKSSSPADTKPTHTAATPATTNDHTAPRMVQPPTNAPQRRRKHVAETTANRNTRRFRRVHVTGPGIARASAGGPEGHRGRALWPVCHRHVAQRRRRRQHDGARHPHPALQGPSCHARQALATQAVAAA